VIAGIAGGDWDLLTAIAASGRDLATQVRQRIERGAVQEQLPLGIAAS
jgi:hypothetical protein